MLFKKYDQSSGKVLKKESTLLINAAKGYVRPSEYGSLWWLSTTSCWNIDELIHRRIRDWRRLTNETGHSGSRAKSMRSDHDSIYTGTMSVSPVPLIEWIILRFGGSEEGLIVDPFTGGPPRGMVAGLMRYKYIGYDIRKEQLDENTEVINSLGLQGRVKYILGDGCLMKDVEDESADCIISCPPYFNLEVYSDLENDLSNLGTYDEFMEMIQTCANSCYRVAKPDIFCCFITSNFRLINSQGINEQVDFPGDCIKAFRKAGFYMHQDVVLIRNFASAAARSTTSWKGKKLIPRHERLLVFRKPGPESIKHPPGKQYEHPVRLIRK